MNDRRSQLRLLDAELVMITWQGHGGTCKQLGNVEDISADGMEVIVDHAFPSGTSVTISYGEGELTGVVTHHAAIEDRHFVGIEFIGNSRNSTLHFQPELLVR
ncbi:MAG: PilZ domain-containing protein [Acidobacteriota bacterium]|nr:PilZ domain-containing protein [Acidobacteriota bacterium]